VRPHIDAALLGCGEQTAQIGVDDVEVDQQLGSVDGIQRLAGEIGHRCLL